jgi:DNA adenine methylase
VVLSGYASPLYDRDLYPDWHRIERQALADGARERTEVLWINAAARRSNGGLF